MTAVTILLLILALAFLTETLTEFAYGTVTNLIVGIFPKLAPLFERSKLRTSVIQLFAIGVGIAGALIYKFDMLHLLSQYLEPYAGAPLNVPTTDYGIIITGVAIGKGSNYIHDFLKRYFVKPDPAGPTPASAATEQHQTKYIG